MARLLVFPRQIDLLLQVFQVGSLGSTAHSTTQLLLYNRRHLTGVRPRVGQWIKTVVDDVPQQHQILK